jgi:putative transposase
MKKSKFTDSQIVKAIKEYEAGRSAADICRELGIHRVTFYGWKRQYAGMDAQQLTELKSLKEENARLKKMYAELALDNMILKDVLSKKP